MKEIWDQEEMNVQCRSENLREFVRKELGVRGPGVLCGGWRVEERNRKLCG